MAQAKPTPEEEQAPLVDQLPPEDQLIPTGMIIALHAQMTPDRKALITSTAERTFLELNQRVNQLARYFRDKGLQPGDGICFMLSNCVEFVEVLFAASRTGLRFTTVNWHLTAPEVQYIIENSDAKAFVTERQFSEQSQVAVKNNHNLLVKLMVDNDSDEFVDYETAIADYETTNIPDPVPGNLMLYTSGTTGHPKGVYRREPADIGALLAMFIMSAQYIPGESINYGPGPLYHSAPIGFSLLLPLAVGITSIIAEKWDAETALKVIEQYKVTHLNMVPFHFQQMLNLPEKVKQHYDLSTLKWVFHTGAPCPIQVKQELMDWIGPIVHELYAGTEGMITLVSAEEWLARPGTVGKPNKPENIKIMTKAGEELAQGEIGYIYCKAPDVGRFEYYKAKEKTEDSYQGGYFCIGDQGYVDRDGYLYVTGRMADLILSGGVNIYPQEVDNVLNRHKAVADVCCVGVPNEEYGEEVKAVIQLASDVEQSEELAQELIDFARDNLAHFKCPKTIEFIDEMPRLEAGKLQRSKIRAMFVKE